MMRIQRVKEAVMKEAVMMEAVMMEAWKQLAIRRSMDRSFTISNPRGSPVETYEVCAEYRGCGE